MTDVARLLARSPAERAREFKYRFAQSTVFGLPVLALQLFGNSLGGPDAARWVGLMQLLLTSWIVYVGAAGILFEGILLVTQNNRFTPDFAVATTATALYLYSIIAWINILRGAAAAMLFHYAVLLLILWSAIQYVRWNRKA